MGRQNLLANIGLMLATILILAGVLIGAEWLARNSPEDELRREVASDLHPPSRTLLHELKPNFSEEFAGAHVTINEQGYRGRLHDGPTRNTRVLMLGDSVTFGWGVADDQTFSHYLETDFPGYETVNFGVAFYGTAQSLIQLQTKGLRLNPDWVILNVCLENDVQDNAFYKSKFGEDATAEFEDSSKWELSNLIFWLRQNSALFFRFNTMFVGEEARQLSWEPDIAPPEEITHTVSLIEQMATIAGQNDLKFLVLLFPHRQDHPSSSGIERQLLAGLEPTQVRVVSMYDEFAKRGFGESSIHKLFLDDLVHLSPRGNKLSAQIIHDLLVERSDSSGGTKTPLQRTR